MKGLLPKKDLLMSLNCLQIDCKDIERCACVSFPKRKVAHFEIPQLVLDYSNDGIEYIGSPDRSTPFIYYTNPNTFNFHQYRRRGANKPYVYIDTIPNENNMLDAFVFNAPLLKHITIVAVFKDLRQLDEMGCCDSMDIENISFIDNEVKKRLTEKFLRYYRATAAPIEPNNQQYS